MYAWMDCSPASMDCSVCLVHFVIASDERWVRKRPSVPVSFLFKFIE